MILYLGCRISTCSLAMQSNASFTDESGFVYECVLKNGVIPVPSSAKHSVRIMSNETPEGSESVLIKPTRSQLSRKRKHTVQDLTHTQLMEVEESSAVAQSLLFSSQTDDELLSDIEQAVASSSYSD